MSQLVNNADRIVGTWAAGNHAALTDAARRDLCRSIAKSLAVCVVVAPHDRAFVERVRAQLGLANPGTSGPARPEATMGR